MLTWFRGGPRYNKMVSEDKIKKACRKGGFLTHKRRVILQYDGTIGAEGYIPPTENYTFKGNNPTLIWQGLNSIRK